MKKTYKKIKFFQLNEKFMKYNTLKRELTSLKNINDNYPKYIITLDYDILKSACYILQKKLKCLYKNYINRYKKVLNSYKGYFKYIK